MLNAKDLLERAVAIPSLSGAESEVARFLVEQMATFCDEAFVNASGSAFGKLGTGPLNITFLGHIDTVPGAIPVRWEEGLLYGRGSVDAKGPFCTAIMAASRLEPAALERLTLTLIGATEEEAPTSKGARHALTAYPKPDLLIIGEPSGWDAVTLGYKGRLIAKLKVKTDNFHSAGEGQTAAEALVERWAVLKQQADAYNTDVEGIFDALQISLQAVSSHTDGLAQYAEATLSYRLPPALSISTVKQMVGDAVTGKDLRFTGEETAHRSEKDTALSRAFRVAIREEGGRPRFKVKTGTSDMNVVAPKWQVPMLAYGPGDSALDHTPQEHVSLGDYEKAIAVMGRALTRLAGLDP